MVEFRAGERVGVARESREVGVVIDWDAGGGGGLSYASPG
jgi:hypothetical protein